MESDSTTERLLRESSTPRRRSRPKQPFRLIAKDGSSLVENERVRNKVLLYLKDVFTTFVHLKWAPLILACALAYIVTWIAFALLWWAASATHTPEGGPCIIRVTNFTSAFLFSVETQTTIGFGDLYVASGCSFGIFLLVLESVSGVILDSFVIGILFTKLARPRLRGRTVLFSTNAVVWRNPKTDRFYLQCRVGDVRKSHILEAHVRAIVFRFTKGNSDTGSDVAIETDFSNLDEEEMNEDGQIPLSVESVELDVGYDQGLDRLFLLFPVIIQHEIDETSPFYDMGPRDLATARIEVLFNLEGTLEATGMLTQKLRSYLPEEILWGYRFEPLIFVSKGVPMADFSRLSDVVRDQTMPQCSPKAYYERLSQTIN